MSQFILDMIFNAVESELINNDLFIFSFFLTRDDQHNRLLLYFESNATLQSFFRE